jgi:hypothetical protein
MSDDPNEDYVQEILQARDGKPTQRKGRGNPPVEHRWRKGQSGNPAGMAPGTVSLTRIAKQKIAEAAPGDRQTVAEELVDDCIRRALRGDSAARKLIWEAIDPPSSRLDINATVEAVDPNDPREKIVAAVRKMNKVACERLSDHLLAIAEGREREYENANTEYIYRCVMEAVNDYDAANMGWAYTCYRNAVDIVVDFERRHPDAAEKYLAYLAEKVSDR